MAKKAEKVHQTKKPPAEYDLFAIQYAAVNMVLAKGKLSADPRDIDAVVPFKRPVRKARYPLDTTHSFFLTH